MQDFHFELFSKRDTSYKKKILCQKKSYFFRCFAQPNNDNYNNYYYDITNKTCSMF